MGTTCTWNVYSEGGLSSIPRIPRHACYRSSPVSSVETELPNYCKAGGTGYSVHDELEFLVEAGLTPGEALEAATRRAAEMLDAEDEFGTIEPGKRADLLILGADPLDDIRNTRSLETVITEGRVVDRDALEVRIP